MRSDGFLLLANLLQENMFCTVSRSEQERAFFITFLQSSASSRESSCTVNFAARSKLHGYKAYFHTDDQLPVFKMTLRVELR